MARDLQEDAVAEFCDRVDRLEQRYEGDRYVAAWLIPADVLKLVRDRLTGRGQHHQLSLFEGDHHE